MKLVYIFSISKPFENNFVQATELLHFMFNWIHPDCSILNCPLGESSKLKTAETWEKFPTGGVIENSKSSQVSVGKSSKRGGGHHISKKS